uniref:maleylacetoacetate isomerase n=1 Tax=Aceria tosichella TaxID=561515 RepID=A0A6G1SAE5_9ACAR
MTSSPIKELTLYSYFYSSAAWRVRSVLALKKIPFKYQCVHLLDGQQHSEDYLKTNPMHQVPSLKVDLEDGSTHTITQSLTIIRFLEENYPEPAIYPKDMILRCKSMAIADTISGGIQPLQNLETLLHYTDPLGLPALDQPARTKVAQFWIDRKLVNLEKLVSSTAGKYCVGDEVSIADVSLVPQMFNARRFGLDTSKYPLLKQIDERLQELEIFKVSHPLSCPDAPKEAGAK